MEVILVFFLYLGQLIPLLTLSTLIPLLIVHRRKASIRSRFFVIPFFLCLSILCGSIYSLSNRPFVYCPQAFRAEFTESRKREAISLNRGFYSSTAPVIPVLISIQDIQEDGAVLVKTYYWFFGGHTQMVFGGSDAPALIHGLSDNP